MKTYSTNIQSQTQAESARALDPDTLQRKAANPAQSVWVNASAGTGKTKVLVDRLLRLLLPDQKQNPGSAPQSILCITFTNAGASEMLLRIQDVLGAWSFMAESDLAATLEKLLGFPPKSAHIRAAIGLYEIIMNIPGGLKIMTIHSFCQSLLARFPLEAGLTPGMQVAEEAQSQQFLQNACDQLLLAAYNTPAHALKQPVENLLRTISDAQLTELTQAIMEERTQLEHLMQTHPDATSLKAVLCKALDISPDETEKTIINQLCTLDSKEYETLRSIAQIADLSSGKADMRFAQIVPAFLKQTAEERTHTLNEFADIFLKSGCDEARKTIITKNVQKQLDPLSLQIIDQIAQRLIDGYDRLKRVKSAQLTADLLIWGMAVYGAYNAEKQAQNMLDYNDLIMHSLKLLRGGTQWVLFKLDQGLNHILLDEAQDTNPEQWEIIRILCDEFFSHQAGREEETGRSLFVVGDEKQSIYSFQRASPASFTAMRSALQQQAKTAGYAWENVDLNISFRSVRAVLQAVDCAFASPVMQKGMGASPVTHESFRRGQAGRVELWPCFEDSAAESINPWDPPLTVFQQESGASKLAAYIADQIAGWLARGDKLPTRDRPIRPGDIMVLMRSRSAFVPILTRALKERNIPVSGADRMVLTSQIAVQDMIAALRFTLLPEDDLNLACLLKSPLIGLDEDALFTLAHPRAASLWQAVQEAEIHQAITDYLKDLLRQIPRRRPYEALSYILSRPCPGGINGLSAMISRLGQDCADPLEELRNAAINFENSNAPAIESFCHAIESEAKTIKRDTEDQANHVRIMTIHASKGLQAPIVILPDTLRATSTGGAKAANRLLWPHQTGLSIPLWTPRKDYDHKPYLQASAALKAQEEEESRRLLYVAMTRAEDQLYIAGQFGKKKPAPQSWYYQLEEAFKTHPEFMQTAAGTLLFEDPQDESKAPDRVKAIASQQEEQSISPPWLHKAAPPPPAAIEILTPSNQGSAAPVQTKAAASPYDAETARLRGLAVHSLLQYLPSLPPEKQSQAAEILLKNYESLLDDATRASLAATVQTLLNDPKFAPIFKEEALTEVPVTAQMTGNKIMKGIIDRLIISKSTITIIDYKTGAFDPAHDEVPPAYQTQIRHYADALKKIYPNHTINGEILWVDAMHMSSIAIEK